MEPTHSVPHRTPGEAIRELRTLLTPEGEKRLSQAQLAKQLGCVEELVQRLETGRARLLLKHVNEMGQLRVPPGRQEQVARVLAELRAMAIQSAKVAEQDGEGAPLGPRSVREGLAVLRGKVEELGSRLATLGTTLAATVRSVEALVGTVVAKVEALGAKADAAAARMATAEEAVKDTGALVDRMDAKVDSTESRVERTRKEVSGKLDNVTRLLLGHAGVTLLGFAILVTLHCQHAPTATPAAAPQAPNVMINVGVGQGAAEANEQERCTANPTSCLSVLQSDGSGQMGKKNQGEKWVPPQPLEGQKRGPCDDDLGEENFGGGCWQGTVIPPPCGRLYRHGDRCYRPITADPKRPLGDEPREVTPQRESQ